MSDIFKDGSVPFPDYDREDTDNFTRKVEFTDDVFVYGNLYANVKSENITFSETTTLADLNVENIFLSGGVVGSSGIFDCLTAKNKFDVGLAGTVFTAISEADGCGHSQLQVELVLEAHNLMVDFKWVLVVQL